MKITTIGIDLAKNVSPIHAVDEHGKIGVNKARPERGTASA